MSDKIVELFMCFSSSRVTPFAVCEQLTPKQKTPSNKLPGKPDLHGVLITLDTLHFIPPPSTESF